MASKKTKVVVNSNGKNIDQAVAAAGQAPLKIKVQKGAKYLLKGDDGFAPENVTLTRVGADLHVTLEGETSPSLVLEGYYAQSEPVGLYGVAEDGQLYAYTPTDASSDIYALTEGQSTPVALGGDSYGPGAPYLAGAEAGGNDFLGGMLPLLLTGGLAALGVGLIAAASGSDGDPQPVGPVVPEPLPPGKPGFDSLSAYDDVGKVQGPIPHNGKTDDKRPDFSGTGATPGNTVTIYDNGKEIGKVVVDGNGAWSLTPSKDLGEGQHSITITESDAGGKTGALNNGDITDDNKPTFNGKAEPGSTVNVYDNGKLLGTAPVGPDGNWSFTPGTPLPDGAHSFTTEVIDPAGNGSGKSDPLNVTVNTEDLLVSIDTLVDDQGAIKGTIVPGGVTDDTRPEIKGTGKVDSTIHVYDGEGAGKTLLGTALVGADGKWSFTPTADLSQGEHTITATATDLSGNVSTPTPVVGFTVDTAAPAAPTIVAAEDDVGAKQGALVNGGVTDDPSPTLSGKAEANSTVTVYDNGRPLGTATADAAGNWAYTPTTPLNEGVHSFTVTATDKAGNTSAPSAEFVLTADFTPPAASAAVLSDNVGAIQGEIASGSITDDNTPTYAGKTEPNATVVIYNEGKEIGRVPADAQGNWSFTPAPLDNGSYSFSNAVIDAAGNAGARGPVTAFTVAGEPVVIRIDGASDDVGKITGAIAKGGVTDDATPTLTGKATADGIVKVYDGATLLGQPARHC
ncbi:hypothetical protein CLU95_5522 [Variovorax sp. 54]|uniref:Ig-like domain-containing protein n=1 Tax=Variovorax sp. 54 TaxID=2035212 RepID=UPI000C18E502|nr:Ig-like domain-containing protein [Variovorax sp. 54]PIF78337.1 hypothetical protein CLU95_5522 [Variovorax sp. 54]